MEIEAQIDDNGDTIIDESPSDNDSNSELLEGTIYRSDDPPQESVVHNDDDEELSADDSEKQAEEKPTCHPRIVELYTTADWWSLWIGLWSFCVAMVVAFVNPGPYSIPQPMPWTKNPLDAWDLYNLVGLPILFGVLGIFYMTSLHFMGTLQSHVKDYMVGFLIMAILATLALWVGGNTWCSSNGLGYAVWSILFGMIITNKCMRNTKVSRNNCQGWRILYQVQFSAIGR